MRKFEKKNMTKFEKDFKLPTCRATVQGLNYLQESLLLFLVQEGQKNEPAEEELLLVESC